MIVWHSCKDITFWPNVKQFSQCKYPQKDKDICSSELRVDYDFLIYWDANIFSLCKYCNTYTCRFKHSELYKSLIEYILQSLELSVYMWFNKL